ncbi:alpha/beta hydrolase [Catellatospora sp. NPDC049609]|uniref:alpha/beta hydrolase n=1 Tax=Catellatospora sp. NPDC049609 TaxID=3155505 RepID=UPI0034389D9B
MSIRRAALVLALATSLLTAPAAPASAADGVVEVSNTVDIRCAFYTMRANADWYFPSGTPRGLVYLQHGFSRSNGNMQDLAEHYAAAGFLVFAPTLPSANLYGCTVNNIGNNTDFLNNVADLLGKATDPNDKLGRSFTDARTRAGRAGLALPTAYVLSGHSAGGEVVSYVANRLRTTYPAQFAKVRSLVLLDPVKSPVGSSTVDAFRGLRTTPLPMYAISSPPYLANSDASGTVALTGEVARPFLGVRLTSGCHCDAEGASTDGLCTLTSGTPQAKNVAALQTLAVAWARDGAGGTTTAAYYPGGAYYDGLLTAGTVQTLSGV